MNWLLFLVPLLTVGAGFSIWAVHKVRRGHLADVTLRTVVICLCLVAAAVLLGRGSPWVIVLLGACLGVLAGNLAGIMAWLEKARTKGNEDKRL